jgi:hypothetical protein
VRSRVAIIFRRISGEMLLMWLRRRVAIIFRRVAGEMDERPRCFSLRGYTPRGITVSRSP